MHVSSWTISTSLGNSYSLFTESDDAGRDDDGNIIKENKKGAKGKVSLGWNYIGANARAKILWALSLLNATQSMYPFQVMSFSLSLQYNSILKKREIACNV